MKHVPQSELDAMLQSIRAHPEYCDPEYMISTYRSQGLKVFPHPLSTEIVNPIKQALLAEKGLSVVRIGDGEINLISYGAYPNTPNLDDNVVEAILGMQQDNFKVDPLWMIILRDLMMGAVAQADIVGVIGLWRPRPINTEQLVQLFLHDYRGISGQWRAMDYMLHLAAQGAFDHKILASAHLYFSLLEHLDLILPLARKIFIISDRERIMGKLKHKYPNIVFEFIPVGEPIHSPLAPRDRPDFLWPVFSSLPADLRGSLCLIGAGPWAEIYCGWIKQRGGVGVDLGTGFDLLDGAVTRPIHTLVGLEQIRKYAL